ncbi:MAG: CCA-adding enzyme [Chloroflexi bacterium ADurb.Bin344]|nr:MAG: CCA-adding enzyme [Chloroflexi bacterium ADurb.Bin344]
MAKQYDYSEIFESIKKVVPSSVQIYLVGGAVRDIILGRKVRDFDFVIEGLVRPVGRNLANELNGKFYVLDDDRNMVRVLLNADSDEYYCIDISQLNGSTLEEDLYSRDFTINAIAIDFIQKNKFIDPMGGVSDLKEKKLRMCNLESIKSDPLRGMRAIRMAVDYDLTMDSDLIHALNEIRPFLSVASVERYRDELFKILDGEKTVTAVRLLDKYAFLDFLFPGKNPTNDEALYDWLRSAEHLINILAREFREDESSNLISGMAVLKLGSFRDQLNEFFYHDNNLIHERRSLLIFSIIARFYRTEENSRSVSEILKSRSKKMLLSTAEMKLIIKSYEAFMELHSLFNLEEYSDVVIYRYFQKFGDYGIDGIFLKLIETHINKDILRDSAQWTKVLDHAARYFDAWFNHFDTIIKPKPLLSGDQISKLFNIPAGPEIGELKNAILEAQIENLITDREGAIKFTRNLIESS